jgi:uncharacterized protein YjiS (DUF1127 family)
MFDDSSTDSGTQLLRLNFMTRALRPWDMFFNIMTRRNTRASLSALDDRFLKDIGISRGGIEWLARHAAGGAPITDRMKQHSPTSPTTTQLNQRRMT